MKHPVNEPQSHRFYQYSVFKTINHTITERKIWCCCYFYNIYLQLGEICCTTLGGLLFTAANVAWSPLLTDVTLSDVNVLSSFSVPGNGVGAIDNLGTAGDTEGGGISSELDDCVLLLLLLPSEASVPLC